MECKILNAADLDFEKEAKKFDYYILMANESKLRSFAWGFIEDLHAIYNQTRISQPTKHNQKPLKSGT